MKNTLNLSLRLLILFSALLLSQGCASIMVGNYSTGQRYEREREESYQMVELYQAPPEQELYLVLTPDASRSWGLSQGREEEEMLLYLADAYRNPVEHLQDLGERSPDLTRYSSSGSIRFLGGRWLEGDRTLSEEAILLSQWHDLDGTLVLPDFPLKHVEVGLVKGGAFVWDVVTFPLQFGIVAIALSSS